MAEEPLAPAKYGSMGVRKGGQSRECCCGLPAEVWSFTHVPTLLLCWARGVAPSYDILCTVPQQITWLQSLAERVKIVYDPQNEQHPALLFKFWEYAFPNEEPLVGLNAPGWRELGFQSDTPVTDVRSGGVFTLLVINWMGLNHGTVLQNVAARAKSKPSYPFFLSCTHAAVRLVFHYELQPEGFVCPPMKKLADGSDAPVASVKSRRSLLEMVAEHEDAFYELIASTIELVDRLVGAVCEVDSEGNYRLDLFTVVTQRAIKEVEQVMDGRPLDIAAMKNAILEIKV